MKSSLSWLIKAAFSVAILVYVFHKVDFAAVWQQAQQADVKWVLIAIGVQILQVPIGGARWARVAQAMESPSTVVRFGFGRATELFYVSTFINLVIPGAVGGDGFRIWRLKQDGIALTEAVSSVMLERVASLFGLFCLVTATEPVIIARIGTLPGAWVFPLLTALGIIGIIVLMLLDRLPRSWQAVRLVRGLVSLAGSARQVFLSARSALPVMMWAVLGHANLALVVWCLAQALHLPIDLLSCLALVPPVILLLTIPISVAGWGVREQAMVTGFGLIGIAAPSALVLSLMFGVVGTIAALPGGLLWLLVKKPSTDL